MDDLLILLAILLGASALGVTVYSFILAVEGETNWFIALMGFALIGITVGLASLIVSSNDDRVEKFDTWCNASGGQRMNDDGKDHCVRIIQRDFTKEYK